MSAVELWTGRDMVTGESLTFDQKDIISDQRERRLRTHPKDVPPEPNFSPGDVVFSMSEGSKTKPRDKLIVRDDLGQGMLRLDRYHESTGKVTRAFLPSRGLYKPKTTHPTQTGSTPQNNDTTQPTPEQQTDNATTTQPSSSDISQPVASSHTLHRVDLASSENLIRGNVIWFFSNVLS